MTLERLYMSYFQYPATDLTKVKIPDKKRKEVRYSVSITYNGGTIIDGKWYQGYEVPPPILADGVKIEDPGFGLCLNSHPPQKTVYLVKED